MHPDRHDDIESPSSVPQLVQWSAADVAAHLDVSASTIRSYLARGQMPAPDGRVGRTPWWHPTTITSWQRPGRGGPGQRRPRPNS